MTRELLSNFKAATRSMELYILANASLYGVDLHNDCIEIQCNSSEGYDILIFPSNGSGVIRYTDYSGCYIGWDWQVPNKEDDDFQSMLDQYKEQTNQ